MRKYLSDRPMLIAAVICSFISVIAFYRSEWLFAAGILLSLGIGAAVMLRKNPALVFALITSLIMLISTMATANQARSLQKYTGSVAECDFIVSDIAYRGNEYSIAVIEITDSNSLPEHTRISVFFNDINIKMGQSATADVRIKRVKQAQRANLYSNGIFLQGELSNLKATKGKDDIFLRAVDKTRSFISKTAFSELSFSSASTFCALVFGERNYFTAWFAENIKRAGVSHTMVVSGMHLAIIISLLTGLSEKLFYNRYLKALIILLTVLFMTALCGFTMSILRAGITYILLAAGLVINRKGNPESLLSTAAVIIMITSPYAIMSVALRLSILSTFGILSVALPIADYVKREKIITKGLFLKLFTAVIITLSATLLTLPVVIFEFGSVSVVSLLTNLLITFAITAVLWIAVFALPIKLVFGGLASVLFGVCELLLIYINNVINVLGELEFAAVGVPKYMALFVLFIIIAVFWILLSCKKKRNMLKLKAMHSKIIKEGGKKVKWR